MKQYLWAMLLIFIPSPIYASPGPLGTDTPFTFDQPPAFSITSIGKFLGATVELIFIIAGLLAFGYLTWGGIQWLISGGDQSQVQTARSRINAALIGLAIIVIGLAVIILIEAFFGISIINRDGTSTIPHGF